MASDYTKFIQEFNEKTASPAAKPKKKRAAWRDADLREHLPKIIGAAVVLGTIYIAWAYWPQRVPALDAPASEIAKYVGSSNFLSLPPDRQKPYLDLIRDHGREFYANMPDDQRDRIRLAMMGQTLNEYVALPIGPERDKFLDKMIDRMDAAREARRAQATTRPWDGNTPRGEGRGGPGGPGGGGAGGPGGGGRGRSPVAQAARIERTPPGIRSGMAQMWADMRARREARGK